MTKVLTADTRARSPHPDTDRVAVALDEGVPPRSLGRVVAFDGLRAVLVAGVLAYHLSNAYLPSSTGETAVIVFFVLSGFLITSLLADEYHRKRTISVLSFYGRRFRRLFPALAALLVVWLVVALIVGPSGQSPWVASVPGGGHGGGITPAVSLEGVISSGLYFVNWIDAFQKYHLWLGYFPMSHLWTLAVEEQFYLVWAPVMVLLVRLRAARYLVSVAAVVALVEPVLLWQSGTDRLYFGTDTRSGPLLLGAALALWWRSGNVPWLKRTGVSTVCLVSGFVGLWVAGIGFVGKAKLVPWTGGLMLASVTGGMIVLTLATRRDDVVSRVLGTRVMTYLGQRSYAIYLWGYVLNTWFRSLGHLTIPVVLGTTLAAAELSYRLVEDPIMRWGRRRRSLGRRLSQVPAPAQA